MKDLGSVHKKIHPQATNSAANLLFNTYIDMQTNDLAQVRISKERKPHISSKLYIYTYMIGYGMV